MRKVAFLMLAKGESLRLPNKNKLSFSGKPLFYWNLSKALKITNKVFFNSDDNYMIKIASKMKVKIINRDKNLLGNEIPSRVLFISSLKSMPKNIDAILSIQANSPNLNFRLIKTVYKLMQNSDLNELLTCDKRFNVYGSLWGLSRKRIINSSSNIKISDKKAQKPDCLILDESIDIHTISDFKKSLKLFKKSSQN